LIGYFTSRYKRVPSTPSLPLYSNEGEQGGSDFDLKNLNLNWNLSRNPVIPQNPKLITLFSKQASKSRLE
jgi:hypothetical protein